jgi:hypothetical protein
MPTGFLEVLFLHCNVQSRKYGFPSTAKDAALPSR